MKSLPGAELDGLAVDKIEKFQPECPKVQLAWF